MNIAFCYETVMPARGGCETYIADLARRLVADNHEVHLYACRWDENALGSRVHFHALPAVRGPRWLRPWRFARQCLAAMADREHDVTIGFDKTYGQDVLYPQGGLHAASFEHNLRKYPGKWQRRLVRALKWFDLAHRSFTRLERRQYLGKKPPLVVVNSFMVREHFRDYLGVPPENLHVVRSAIDPGRFPEHDRLKRRQEFRQQWDIAPTAVVGLFAAMNYRLKGLGPLLHALARLNQRTPTGCGSDIPVRPSNGQECPPDADVRPDDLVTAFEWGPSPPPFRLLVVGHPNTRRYQKLARALGVADQVRFAGHCDQMKSAYFAADFLVHPTFYDPCSLVALEALACGLPVITTRANGASELVEPTGAGYVIDDPHDPARLAWCVAQMLDQPRRQTFAQAARRAAAGWTFEQHFRQLVRVLKEASRRKRAA
jgi:UDP-glucose:(heptosyl)LPS alpha-1,3-glucosyltransferase